MDLYRDLYILRKYQIGNVGLIYISISLKGAGVRILRLNLDNVSTALCWHEKLQKQTKAQVKDTILYLL